MKIIDLLVKISQGEIMPKKIKYEGYVWEYDKDAKDYYRNNIDEEYIYLFQDLFKETIYFLNNVVEIIEEDTKLKKINLNYSVPNAIYDMKALRETLEEIIENQRIHEDRINELIDEINKLKGEE